MSKRRQANAVERPADITNNSSSGASRQDGATSESGRRRGTNAARRKPQPPAAAANSTTPLISEVIMIEAKTVQSTGTEPSTPKRTRRRESKPFSSQSARPDIPAGSGGSKSSVGRSERAPGSTAGARSERGSRAPGKGKDVATATTTAPSVAPKYNVQPVKPKPATTPRSKTWFDGDAKQRASPRQIEKQVAEVAQDSTKPVAGRMSKTLQRDIEAQKARRTRKPEVKAGGTSTVSSIPKQVEKALIPDAQDKEPRLKPETRANRPSQKPTETDKVRQAIPETDIPEQKPTETHKVRQAILETDIPRQKPTETAEEPVDESKTKPATKICIRWLPADLPEHVFWSSVEPALPWFDPENVGSVKQKDREVLCAMIRDSDKDNELDSAEETATDEAPAVTELRRLPLAETKAVAVNVYESGNLARLDCQPYWRQYSPGKQHKSRAKPDEPSQAYILFAEPAEADHFYQHFHGHAFGKNGVINRAVVELAPFQHVPWSLSAPASNPLEGTIDGDPHFAAFLKASANGKTQDDEQTGGAASLSAASAETQQSRISYAAAASLGKDGAQGSSKAVKATPLIEHLRKIKTGSSKPLALAAKTVEPASPAKPPPAVAKSGRKKAAPAKEPAPLATTQKRSRRRKRE